jgi:hypothetical protein
MATSHDRGPAEQQGDGQPENMNELRDSAGGSALAGGQKNVPPRAPGASAESPRGRSDAHRGGEHQPRGGSQADGAEEPDSD